MKTEGFIKVWIKSYKYIIEKKDASISRFICHSASIDQEFLNEDLVDLLNDLPNLILSECSYRKKQDWVIRFRISWVEKLKLQKKLKESWYKNLSEYIRNKILS